MALCWLCLVQCKKEKQSWENDGPPYGNIAGFLYKKGNSYNQLSPPTLCNSAIQTRTHKHTHTKSKGEGIFKSTLGAVLDVAGNILPLRLWVFFFYPFLSYLPVLVRTIMALAEHLKEDSTAPTATASEGSLVSWECLLSSSNSCLWKVAASASRAIWAPNDHEGRVGGYSQSHTTTTAHRVIHTPGSAWKTLS